MEFLCFLSMTFAELPGGKSTDPCEFNISDNSPLKYMDLVLIPSAKLNGHRGTWTGCLHLYR